MTATVAPAGLTHELLAWVRAAPRTYADVLETWVTSCPRHPVWDEARAGGLVAVADGLVVLTPRGEALLAHGTDGGP